MQNGKKEKPVLNDIFPYFKPIKCRLKELNFDLILKTSNSIAEESIEIIPVDDNHINLLFETNEKYRKLKIMIVEDNTININIDNRKTSLAGRAFDPLEPESYSQSVAQTVYDAEGTSHILSLYYKKVNSADLILTDSGSTGTSLTFSVEQEIGTTLNGEQTNRLATTAVASSVTGSTQTLENISTTYVSGGIEEED